MFAIHQSDVLVNSLGKCDADLNECGVVAKAFLAKVGQPLQDDFKKTGGLKKGQVAETSVCDNLQCKMLLHLSLDKWQGDQTKQVVIYSLLEIVFPWLF